MVEAHGKQVRVKIRVYSHAHQSKKVYKIWLNVMILCCCIVREGLIIM